MTTLAEELLGAQVTGADGKVVGTVEQVFGDDADEAPTWARVRSGKTSRFVPLSDSHVTGDGLNVPFDAQKIMTGPKIDVGQHMSAEQAEELDRYFSSQTGGGQTGGGQTGGGQTGGGQTGGTEAGGKGEQGGAKAEKGGGKGEQQGGGKPSDEWLTRREERLEVGKETVESGHVKLHRYVDQQPVEKTVHLEHEEFEVERVPVGADEPPGEIEEGERDITLHEERGITSKQTVPVERMRLVAKNVGEDKTFQDDVRRERIEVEADEVAAGSGRARARAR